VLEKHYGLAHRQTTTHAGAPLVIVNGPIIKDIGLNYGNGVFGPGWRANATIGRALRLTLVNVGGAIPAETDFCQHGHPGKYTYCIAEHQAANPWSRFMSSAASRPRTVSSRSSMRRPRIA